MAERNRADLIDLMADAMFERSQRIDYGLRHRESQYWTELADAAASVAYDRQQRVDRAISDLRAFLDWLAEDERHIHDVDPDLLARFRKSLAERQEHA